MAEAQSEENVAKVDSLGGALPDYVLQLKMSYDKAKFERIIQVAAKDYTFYQLHCYLQSLLEGSSEHSHYFRGLHSGLKRHVFIGDRKSFDVLPKKLKVKNEIFLEEARYNVIRYFIYEKDKVSYTCEATKSIYKVELEEIKDKDPSVSYPNIMK